MRVNVYGEELTHDGELVSKDVTDNEFGTRTFYGLRMYLESPAALHHSKEDDDRSAITIWVPWTKKKGHNKVAVKHILEELAKLVDVIPETSTQPTSETD